MTQRDFEKSGDRELEQYLKGGSKLSRRYRDASGETSPPDLDEAILARARAEAKRKPDLNRLLAPVALAASIVIGVNLAWNVFQFAPAPGEAAKAGQSRDDRFAPEPPPAEPLARAEAPAAAPAPRTEYKKERARPAPEQAPATAPREAEADAARAAREQARERQARSEERVMASERAADSPAGEAPVAQKSAGAAAPAAALAPSALADAAPAAKAAPLSEARKIDRLIDYIRTLPGAVFIRNGKDYGPAEAAGHLQLKREKAGSRVKTADDFIRLCASHSSMSGDAYLIRFADGRTRTAEDVLREELARINAAD